MLVSRDYCRYNDIKPVSELLISGGENHGLVLDVVHPDMADNVHIDDVDIFGSSIDLDDGSEFIVLPKTNGKVPNGKRIVKRATSSESSSEHGFRDCLLVLGPSGSGKTHYATRWLRQYKRLYPKNNLVLISPINDNIELLELNPHVINCTDPDKSYCNFIDEETKISVEMLSNSCVIFDDLEAIESADKNLTKAIHDLLNKCLTTGRHYNISVCLLRHSPVLLSVGRTWVQESNLIVIFPSSGINYSRLLGTYMGLSNSKIKYITGLQSRAVTISRQAPMFLIAGGKFRALNDIK